MNPRPHPRPTPGVNAEPSHLRRRNPALPATWESPSVISPPWENARAHSLASRRWGGRRIHDLDDGGLWSSDEAGAKGSSGVLVGREWILPLARRAPMECGLLSASQERRHVRPAPKAAMSSAEIRLGSNIRAANRRARDPTTARGVSLVETVTNSQTGRGPAPRSLPILTASLRKRRTDAPALQPPPLTR